MIDAEQYLDKLWSASFVASPLMIHGTGTDVWVAPDIDVNVLDELPALTWNLTGDGDAAQGPGAEGFLLTTNVFGEGMDQAKATAMHVDDVVLAWFEDPWATAVEFDGVRVVVSEGERIDTPTRAAAAMIDGRNVVQYSGSYRLLLRS